MHSIQHSPACLLAYTQARTPLAVHVHDYISRINKYSLARPLARPLDGWPPVVGRTEERPIVRTYVQRYVGLARSLQFICQIFRFLVGGDRFETSEYYTLLQFDIGWGRSRYSGRYFGTFTRCIRKVAMRPAPCASGVGNDSGIIIWEEVLSWEAYPIINR